MMTLRGAAIVAAMSLFLGAAASPQRSSAPAKDSAHMQRAAGTFDVTLVPQPLADAAADATLRRLSIDKRFHGDLEATSRGEMLSAGTAMKDSAGYVAIERVTGTLNGRKGSFVLQHSGTMNRGVPQLSVAVVPDSGTDTLNGLTGTMTIDISGGKHAYVFDYSLKAR
jgi:hypothetical protein